MAPRAYNSPIRELQVEQTRIRLLTTTLALLESGFADELTLPRLAQEAGVSIPTVYRHFPTLDDLHREFLAWIRPRLGQTPERLLDATPETIPELPVENFARFEENARVLHALMESRAWNRVRVGSVGDRARRGAAALRPAAHAGWRDDDLEAAAGAIYALTSPQSWRWLRETWGLDAARAARGASWAMRVLIAALGEPPPRSNPTKKRSRR